MNVGFKLKLPDRLRSNSKHGMNNSGLVKEKKIMILVADFNLQDGVEYEHISQ